MRLEQLIFVQEVNKTKSMSTAAANLFVTPQYISKAIKQLEDELSVAIFRRSKSGTFPTLKGEQICKLIEDILHQIDSLSSVTENNINNQCTRDTKKITIYLPQIVDYILKPLYKAFLQKYPDTTLNIYQEESLALLLTVEKIYPDIFILSQEKGETVFIQNVDPLYDVYYLYEDTLSYWCLPGNIHNEKSTVPMKALAKTSGLIVYADIRQKTCMIEKLFLKRGLILKPQMKINNVEECVALALINEKYGFVESSHLSDYLRFQEDGICLMPIPLKEKPIIIYRLFVKKDLSNDTTTQNFLYAIKKVFSKTFRKISISTQS